MEILNTPEVDELKRRIAKSTQAAEAKKIGLSESMVSYVLKGERILKNEKALEQLGFVDICARVPIAQASKVRKAIKELIAQ